MGKNFDIAASVSRQLPFFSCMNIALNNEFQRDISRYLYCQKFNTPPFKGSYDDQPYKWISKCNHIESSISKKQEIESKKLEKQAGK